MKHKFNLKNFVMITIGVLLIAFGYYFFFLPQNLVTGGVTGISIILNKVFDGKYFSPSLFILIANVFLLFIGLIFLGKSFFIKTVYGSLVLPLVSSIFEFCGIKPDFLFTIDAKYFNIGEFTPLSQLLITIIFGGLLTAIGLGLCFRNNGTTGGMDVIQKLLAKYFHFPYSKTVYVTDGVIVVSSLFVFGVERSAYALVCIFLIGIIVDYISMGGRPRRTAFIISSFSDEIKKVIIDELGRGVTVVESFGGFSEIKYDMLICTLSKNESYVLRDLIAEIDPAAFTFYVTAKEVYGDGFQ